MQSVKTDIYSLIELIDLFNKFDRNKKVYTIGNGGSAALAEHFAQDLLKKCHIPAIFLGNISNITAFGNDIKFEEIFSSQLETLINNEDILICFSSSGNSLDIVNACNQASDLGAWIVSFTGFSGGQVKSISDINIYVPSDNYGIVETIHSLLFHFIIDSLCEKIGS